MYRGEDAAEMFVRKLQQEAKQLCEEYITTPKSMLFTMSDSLSFAYTTTCHICTNPLGEDKVRAHCHITGKYRECNLNYRIKSISWKVPVVIHNLKGYDSHLIVTALKNEFGKVRVIPQNMEKYLSLTVGQLQFLDSFQFTNQSLGSLVNTLECGEFKYLSESYISDHFELVRRKGVYPYDYMELVRRKVVYPYDYMDSSDIFEETALPSQDAFFNKLSGSPCSDTEYTHATRVWDAFGCQTIADYHDIYLQLDVLLLADFSRSSAELA